MRKPNSDEVICVNCGPADSAPAQATANGLGNGIAAAPANGAINVPSSDEEELIQAAPQPLRERILQSSTTHSRGASQPVDSSQAIADKMLEGWALLAEHCPQCSTPLVRSRDGRIYCVSCQLYAVRESDLSAAGQAAPAEQPRSGEAPSTAATDKGAAAVPPTQRRSGQATRNAPIFSSDVQQNINVAQTAISQRLANRATALIDASDGRDLLEEIEKCVQVLKMMKDLE